MTAEYGGMIMATWSEIQTYIRRNFVTRELDNGALSLTFGFDGGRSQACFIDTNNEEDSWIIFRGIVADWSPENAVKALEKNESIFGIERFLDWVVVTHAQLTETADTSEIDHALRGVAIASDNLEEIITGGDAF